MTNIFENAKFGDKFRTRDGRMALFISPTDFYEDYKAYELEVQYEGLLEYIEDGRKVMECGVYGHKELDIIGKWEEHFSEDELFECAMSSIVEFLNTRNKTLIPYNDHNEVGDGTWNLPNYDCNDLFDMYVMGYREAKLGK